MMVAMLAAMHGWSVLYLGPDLPAEEIAYAVDDTNAQLLMVSVTNLDEETSRAELAAIERAVPDTVKIMAGGRAAATNPKSRIAVEHDLERVASALSR